MYIVFSKMPADAELSNDFIDNLWLRGPFFEECENSRSDEIEVEHLTLPDIEDDCAVLAVCAAHCVGDSVHLTPHLLDVWAHCDTLRRLKTRKKFNLPVKRHLGRNLAWDQQDASLLRAFARHQSVRFSVVNLRVWILLLISGSQSPDQRASNLPPFLCQRLRKLNLPVRWYQ